MAQTDILHEISPLMEKDALYIADRHKKENRKTRGVAYDGHKRRYEVGKVEAIRCDKL